MPPAEQFEILVVGSGKGGRLLARDMAQSGRRTAVVKRQWIGGACHTVACLPSNNEIWSARVAQFVPNAAQFGLTTGPVTVDMAGIKLTERPLGTAPFLVAMQ